ncbi:MAG: T9SS type A sorting domain-containing protein [Ignavibacteria bacterium]|nr:T9SS type A sorting domain-containing protein [Ignavibacteria bacterium]MBT8381085.1 T9SS type A sorting domain-containing protein [Ignavibacteria bacterium]MBT8391916.1 T9SS type A sorting domain-containing protein [Ignavibacteria bacterium]NNJ53636.1 T9SS type A sorting domain-containing protein [Ignavibacteriaceae bacterium]NNL19983.1 T9SS type A sorting domain-containing protein [Ignavibacteriaceae bacterium]
MKFSSTIILAILSIFISAKSFATVIEVPNDYPTIQQAINASNDGDTVIVSPDRYYENINFNGKNILVTSHYIFNNDINFISNTIIDGSQPNDPDTASCVLIISGEDSSAILQGFTLTGGTGTKWTDEHGAGIFFEGGGILITLSSPTIKNNLIMNNEALRTGTGVTSAGGGGIRVGDGNPHILNNVIMYNSGMYGGGIVLNYTGAVIRNNIIYNNQVFQAVAGAPTFGGGGIWAFNNLGSTPKIIENNTIVGNTSSGTGSGGAGKGGGILVWATTLEVKNNIIWSNTQITGTQVIQLGGGIANLFYNLVEGGWPGTGNIDVNPNFEETHFYLSDSSACIDAGDPDTIYNDPGAGGIAIFPSKGSVRNDMGAYGGPATVELAEFTISSVDDNNLSGLNSYKLEQNYPNPFNPSTNISFRIAESGFSSLKVYDVLGNEISTLINEELSAGEYEVVFDGNALPSGIYFYQLKVDEYNISKKMVLIK